MIDVKTVVRKSLAATLKFLSTCFVHLLLLFFLSLPVVAQSMPEVPEPLQGVVWREPTDPAIAAEDLVRMREMGVQAIRTPPVEARRLLTLADTLGLTVLQDLPLSNLPAYRLRDTLRYALRTLAPLVRRAHSHPSSVHFGLATNSDTSDSLACAFFEQAAAYVRRQGPPHSRVYYVTRIIEEDRCGRVVDFVLLDALGSKDPLAILRRWRQAHPNVPVGLAAVGTWVSSEETRGLGVPGSPEEQARYLERHLRRLLLDEEGVPLGVFVYQWRDEYSSLPSPAFDLRNPYLEAFGLFNTQGEARPAASVVAGIYGQRQMVFAFPAGEVRPHGPSVSTMTGWTIILLLGVIYFASPRFRQMVPRYFGARGFYREAIREGRDVLLVAAALPLAVFSLSVGVIWMVVIEAVRSSPTFVLLHGWLPVSLGEVLVTLLAQPWMLLVVLSCIYASSVTIWSASLAFAARNRYPLSPAQAIMLTTWPRWPLMVAMIAAMVVATMPAEQAFRPALYLVLAWLAITLFATVRALVDYRAITRVPPTRALAMAFFNPFVLLLIALLVVASQSRPEIAYLWHTIVRG